MNKFEGLQVPIIDQAIDYDKLYEQVFVSLINSRIIEEFEDDLSEVLESDDVDAVLDKINAFSPEEQKMILSIPKSIRQTRFKSLIKKIFNQSGFNAVVFVNTLLDDAQRRGLTLGYHASPSEIIEEKSDWVIEPTDFDDRDNRPMAYYSLDYKNMYRKNRGRNIYVVRAETGENSTHKRDTSNNWGRANKLSIITKLNLQEIDERVRKIIDQKLKEAA